MNSNNAFINHSPLAGENKTALGSALASCLAGGFNYFTMEEFKKYLHYQIYVFAKRYEGSPAADEIISLKKKIDEWLNKRTQSIHEFYVKGSEKSRSYLCKFDTFAIRLIFYKSGESRIVIRHEEVLDKTINDERLTSEYCFDTGSVYFIESEFGWKIGKTKDLKKRKQKFDVTLPFKFAIRFQIKTPQKSRVERYFHSYFKDKLIDGEWFSITREDIQFAVLSDPSLKLSTYSPDDHIKVKYIKPELIQTPTSGL